MIRHIEENIVPGAEICFLHFCSRTTTPGAFERYPTSEQFSNIYVNSGANDWYLKGIPSLGNLGESALALEERARSGGAKRIVCIGASMGAFGAAAIACKTHQELICFGPELWPNIYTGFSRKDLPADVFVDISEFGSPSRSLLVAGMGFPTDVICSSHFNRLWDDSTAIYLPDCGHEAARNLKNRGLLSHLINTFATKGDLSQFTTLSQAHALVNISQVSPRTLDGESLSRFVEEISDKLLVADAMRLAHRLVGQRVFHVALKLFANLRANAGELPEMLLLESTALRKLKRYQESLSVLRTIERHAVLRPHAAFEKAMALEGLGRRAQAISAYKDVVSEFDDHAILRACKARLEALSTSTLVA